MGHLSRNGQEIAEVVNAEGGNATLVHLPETGIRGNTPFPMPDINNVQIANQKLD